MNSIDTLPYSDGDVLREAPGVGVQDFLDLTPELKCPPPPRLEDDLEVMTTRPQSVVARLRHSHHLLARSLAEGKSNIQAAAISGYTPGTVTSLKNDPAFQELVTHYREQVSDLFEQIQDRLGALGLSFLDELQHRLEQDPGQFSIGQLRGLAESLLDRSVAPQKGQKAGQGIAGPAAISVNIKFAEATQNTQRTIELRAEGAPPKDGQNHASF